MSQVSDIGPWLASLPDDDHIKRTDRDVVLVSDEVDDVDEATLAAVLAARPIPSFPADRRRRPLPSGRARDRRRAA